MAYALYDDEEEANQLGSDLVPCEFCGELFPFNILMYHQSGCRPDLVHWAKTENDNNSDKDDASDSLDEEEKTKTLDLDKVIDMALKNMQAEAQTSSKEQNRNMDKGLENTPKKALIKEFDFNQGEGNISFSNKGTTEENSPEQNKSSDSCDVKNQTNEQKAFKDKNIDSKDETIEKLLQEFQYFRDCRSASSSNYISQDCHPSHHSNFRSQRKMNMRK